MPQHVLRFWETRFAQVKPMKRGGGRRLYRPDHVALLRGIKALLYDDGLTIKGVQKMLREKGAKTVIARGKADAELSLERVEHATEEDGMLPLELPENAAEKLEDLRSRPRLEGRPGHRGRGPQEDQPLDRPAGIAAFAPGGRSGHRLSACAPGAAWDRGYPGGRHRAPLLGETLATGGALPLFR